MRLKITKPGEYRTRDGMKAIIRCIDWPGPYTLRGHYEKETECNSWTEGGQYYIGSTQHSVYDIIGPWLDDWEMERQAKNAVNLIKENGNCRLVEDCIYCPCSADTCHDTAYNDQQIQAKQRDAETARQWLRDYGLADRIPDEEPAQPAYTDHMPFQDTTGNREWSVQIPGAGIGLLTDAANYPHFMGYGWSGGVTLEPYRLLEVTVMPCDFVRFRGGE